MTATQPSPAKTSSRNDAPPRARVILDEDALVQAFLIDERVDEAVMGHVIEAVALAAKNLLVSHGVVLNVAHKKRRKAWLLMTRKRAAKRSQAKKALEAKDEAENLVLTGEGIGKVLSERKGLEALRARAHASTPEDWAGPLAGIGDTAERIGVSRSTLDNWRRSGDIIALPKGKKAHSIPLQQFLDGRPLPGLARILEQAKSNPVVAWRWLVTPLEAFGRAPIEALRDGMVEDVVEAAEWSLG